MNDFDLIVLGGGAAGEKGAAQAAYFGKRVALVEKELVHGGAMVNTGTLPSKTLRETALYVSGLRQRGLHGVDLTLSRELTVRDLLFRLERVVSEERGRIKHNLEQHGVKCFHGAGKFVDANTVEVTSDEGRVTRLTGTHVLIATGSTPHRPAAFPFEHTRVYDSDEIVRVQEVPKSMTVVGGGVIGCEYACLFAALGASVTLVENKERVMSFLDDEIGELLTHRMKALGIRVRTSNAVQRCETSDASVRITLESGEVLESDNVLVCAGRQANTANLNIAAAGLTAGKRGHLEVDAQFRTKVPHIAAAGDVIGFPALASTSMDQARVAVVHMFDLKYKTALAPIFPYGIYTIPEVSMAGETEASLMEKGVAAVVGKASFKHNARGLIIGEEGLIKLVFRKDDMRLVGAHIIGEGATELIHIALVAMMSNATSDVFIQSCFNYPTLSESFKYAAYDALGRKAKGAA